MLKIKDNKDLKELEKFGFTVYESGFSKKELEQEGDSIISINITQKKQINIDVQYGEFQGSTTLYEQLDILYDLQEAGLVEKVEE